MAQWCGNFTPSSTAGNQSFSGLPFLPTSAIITVAKKGSSDTTLNYSEGKVDGTRQSVRAIFGDATGFKTEKTNTDCVYHLARLSGSIAVDLRASFVSWDTLGGGNFGFTFNFATLPTPANSYQFNGIFFN